MLFPISLSCEKEHLSSCDLELWPVTVTYKLDLVGVKTNNRAICPHQRLFYSKVIVWTLTDTHSIIWTTKWPINICLPTGVALRSEVDVFSGVCLFLCQSLCLFVHTITSERLNIGRWNLAIRCIVQKSRPSSNVNVKGQRSRSPRTKTRKKLLSHPHWKCIQ